MFIFSKHKLGKVCSLTQQRQQHLRIRAARGGGVVGERRRDEQERRRTAAANEKKKKKGKNKNENAEKGLLRVRPLLATMEGTERGDAFRTYPTYTLKFKTRLARRKKTKMQSNRKP